MSAHRMFEIHVDCSSCPSERVDLGTPMVCNEGERYSLLLYCHLLTAAIETDHQNLPKYRPSVTSDLAGRRGISD